jgi:hypothetical protein
VVALDIAPAAIARAVAKPTPEHVEFRAANVMEYDPRREGPWDLVVLAEMIYFLGWLYSFFDVAWLAAELFGATREGGRLHLANTFGGDEEPLLHPWIIERTAISFSMCATGSRPRRSYVASRTAFRARS